MIRSRYSILHSLWAKEAIISVIIILKDKLLEENRITFDDEKRKEILDKWQRLVYDDQPVTFLWSEPVDIFTVTDIIMLDGMLIRTLLYLMNGGYRARDSFIKIKYWVLGIKY
ncbi:MAG: hypothetical protein R3A12_08685 [Ignavibacteria bacterium]